MIQKTIYASTLVLFVLLMITWTESELTGIYVYINDGKCYFLPFDSDTLTLHENGEVESRNFSNDAVFTHEKSFFKNEIIILSEKKKESSQLLVKGNFLFGKKLLVCVDQKGYYLKQ